MVIRFYLNDGKDTEITSFESIDSNPFNIGDVINLEVTDRFRNNNHPVKLIIKFNSDNEELIERFNLEKVKIVSEFKLIRFNLLDEPKLIMNYFCEFV